MAYPPALPPPAPDPAAPVAPAVPEPPPDPRAAQVPIPMSAEDVAKWETRVSRARQARKEWEKVWEQNLDAYQPEPADLTKDRDRYETNPNVDFRQVEQKGAQLFYERPEVLLEPKEPIASELGAARVVTLRQAVLNTYLGPKPEGVDAKRTIQRSLKDVLVTSGMGWTKLGWRVINGTLEPGPETTQMLGTALTAPLQIPIYDAPFWEPFSATRGLKPHDAVGVDGDEWDWIGMEFTMPLTQARREFALPDDFGERGTRDDGRMRKPRERTPTVPIVKGVAIEYYRARFHDDIVHPQVIYELVLLDGLDDEPARHRPCPYQTVDDDGRLSADSITGYLIQTLTTRDPVEGSDVLSDCSVTRPLVNELATYRSQNLKQRDMAAPIVTFREDAIDEERRDNLRGNGYAHLIPVDPAQWRSPDPFTAVAMPAQSRDSYEGAAILERDIERSLALGAPQTGGFNSGRRSATEVQVAQNSTDARLAVEQGRLVDGYLKGVAKLDALIQRMGRPSYVRILGPQGAAELEQVDPSQLPGRMLYTIKPDSQLYVDAGRDRAQFLQLYNILAASPSANRYELESVLVRKFGLDPQKLLTPPQPSPPPPPKVSVSIQMTDLLTPAAPVAIKLLMNQPITPDDVNLLLQMQATTPTRPEDVETAPAGEAPTGQPEHPGPVEKAEPLDAHQARRTAAMEGTGL